MDPLTLRPLLILDHDSCCAGSCETLNGPLHIHGTSVPGITIGHDRERNLPIGVTDFVAHLCHGDVSCVGETVGGSDRVAGEEDHGEACFFDETG